MKKEKTKFASPERSSQKEVLVSKEMIASNKIFLEALNAFPEAVLVFNNNRQIVYCNNKVLTMLGRSSVDEILGKRLGEAFCCIHSEDEDAGCGTTIFCRQCGAVRSILDAQMGEASLKECRVTARKDKGEFSLDLSVWTVPLKIAEEVYTLCTIRNIEDKKRREALELTFFHDMLNDLHILIGYARNVQNGILIEGENPGKKMSRYALRLINTINAQRDLLAAERDEYELKIEKFFVMEFLNELLDQAENAPWARNKKIELICDNPEDEIETDRNMLNRSMTNLIKNAMEATESGGKITVRYRNDGKHVLLVHNDAVMPQSVKLQVFQRSFSTKGNGRGIGTYSVKLFTEKYLNGEVSFISEEGKGTIFMVKL